MAPGQGSHLNTLRVNMDPRSASMQSLHSPATAVGQERRKLLLIYIHGFLGDETSFKEFPAHVHHCLTEALKERIIHTKVYPKYKTREKIEQVREIFSQWLAPHESSDQDVILVGHSMGGILAAEVALLPSYGTGSVTHLRHRILGTINLDVPFLGLHPGIIGSGIGSLFRPAAKPERSPSPAHLSTTVSTESASSGHESHASLQPTESNGSLSSYNGTGATTPTASASQSSVSLSIPLNDPNYDPKFSNDVILKKRRGRSNFWHFINKHSNDLLHAAETWVTSHAEFGGAMADYKALKRRYDAIRDLEDRHDSARVRFVNYYTVCHGRPKVRKYSASKAKEVSNEAELEAELDQGLENIHIDEDVEAASEVSKPPGREDDARGHATEVSSEHMGQSLYPPELPSGQRLEQLARGGLIQGNHEGSEETGPPCSRTTSGDVETENLEQAVDNNESERGSKEAKPKKDKKFCSLPRKRNGERDPCWVQVFMPNVDEVGAHCGLFSMEEDPDRYELFVQDVSMRIVDWISESPLSYY